MDPYDAKYVLFRRAISPLSPSNFKNIFFGSSLRMPGEHGHNQVSARCLIFFATGWARHPVNRNRDRVFPLSSKLIGIQDRKQYLHNSIQEYKTIYRNRGSHCECRECPECRECRELIENFRSKQQTNSF